MSTIIQGPELRTLNFGRTTSKSTGTLAATTVGLFTVAGGQVALTSIYGIVTTPVTVANVYKLQHTPTTGTAADLCEALDIGTTDTPAGDLLGISVGVAGAFMTRDGAVGTLAAPIILTAGTLQSVSAGTDGVINWIVTWVPMSDGASLVAA
jgi:hypothetical protein